MGYLVQGFNTTSKQWDSLPYETEDRVIHYVWPTEHMAIEGMKAFASLWEGSYRVIKTQHS